VKEIERSGVRRGSPENLPQNLELLGCHLPANLAGGYGSENEENTAHQMAP